jgi:tetratricopeptide (TPR) repeat protein
LAAETELFSSHSFPNRAGDGVGTIRTFWITRLSLWQGALLGGLWILASGAPSQFLVEGDLGLTPPRTGLSQLLSGVLQTPNPRQARLESERAVDGLRAVAQAGNPDHRDDLAIALLRIGRLDEAERLMRKNLDVTPNRTRTLHNLAMLLIRAGKLDEAQSVLMDLGRAEPGYAQGLVDGMQSLVTFRRAQNLQPDWSQRNLLTPELTAQWQARLAAADQLPDAAAGRQFVEKHIPSLNGLLETLRRFPDFGDGWMSLGVMQEIQGDLYLARKCYRLAVLRGTGQRSVLESHLKAIEDTANRQDPARMIGPRVLWTFGIGVVVLLLFLTWKFVKAAQEDIRQWRANQDLAPKKGSHGPLGTKRLE